MLVMAAACSSDEQQEQQQPPLVDISSVLPTDTVYMCSWIDDESSEYLYMYDLDSGESEKRHRSFCQRCYQDTVLVKKVKK